MKCINRQIRMIGMIVLPALIAAQCASPAVTVAPTAAVLVEPTEPAVIVEPTEAPAATVEPTKATEPAESAEAAAMELPEMMEPVELTCVSDFHILAPALDSVEPVLIDQFETVQPNIKISRNQLIKPPSEYLADSPLPDLMALTLISDDIFDPILPTISQGVIFDISEIWTRAGLIKTYPAYFRELGQRDGKQYFLPISRAWVAVYYNKQIFEQYNLEPPTTWAEFLAVSDTLLANNVPPIALGGSCDAGAAPRWSTRGAIYWFDYLNMRLNGPDFQVEFVQGQEQFDEDKIREVFETWQSLFDQGYFAKRANSTSLLQSINQVVEGKAAMILANSADVGGLPEQFQEALDFFPFPIIDPNVPVGEIIEASGYVILAEASQPQAAMEFLAYLVSVEGQTALTQQFGSTGGVLPVNEGIEVTDLAPKMKQGLALIQDADHLGSSYVSGFINGGGMNNPAHRAFCKFLRDPENLETILADLEQACQN